MGTYCRRRSNSGTALAPDDGRGPLAIGGLWLVYLAGRSTFTAEEKKYVAGLGGKLAAGFGLVYLAAGLWAASVKAGATKARRCALYPAYKIAGFAGYGWIALVVVAIIHWRDRRLRQNQRRMARMGRGAGAVLTRSC